MPWARTDWMSQRVKFIATYLECEVNFLDLCRDFGVSRKTGYKWVRRYEDDGAAGLEERSRAAHAHQNATPARVVQAILAVRRRHPRWRPRKLQVVLTRRVLDHRRAKARGDRQFGRLIPIVDPASRRRRRRRYGS